VAIGKGIANMTAETMLIVVVVVIIV